MIGHTKQFGLPRLRLLKFSVLNARSLPNTSGISKKRKNSKRRELVQKLHKFKLKGKGVWREL